MYKIKQIFRDGYNDAKNEHTFGMGVFNNKIYMGTRNIHSGSDLLIIDESDNIEVIKSVFGMDNIDTYGFHSFNNSILIGTYNKNGGELYSLDSKHKISNIFKHGFDDPNNKDIWSMCIRWDNFYFGTWNPVSGTAIFKMELDGSISKIYQSSNNKIDYARNMVLVDNDIYVFFGKNNTDKLFIKIDSLDNIEMNYIPSARYINDFYTAVVKDKKIFLSAGGHHKEKDSKGCEVWIIQNSEYKKINESGFGNWNNYYVQSLEFFGDTLFAATYNINSGCEIWFFRDNHWHLLKANGIVNNPNNESVIYGLKSFNNSLYISCRNSVEGFQLFKLN